MTFYDLYIHLLRRGIKTAYSVVFYYRKILHDQVGILPRMTDKAPVWVIDSILAL